MEYGQNGKHGVLAIQTVKEQGIEPVTTLCLCLVVLTVQETLRRSQLISVMVVTVAQTPVLLAASRASKMRLAP